ncbi:MAG: hypothetical protein WA087_01215 [Candidatus Saccharimonadales bacterium]
MLTKDKKNIEKQKKKRLLGFSKSFIILASVIIITLSVSLLPVSSYVFADEKEASFEESTDNKIRKLLLVSSFAWCIANHAEDSISLDDADEFNFVRNRYDTTPGVYLAGDYSIDSDGTVNCGERDYRDAVFNAIGNISKVEFFCNSGARFVPEGSKDYYSGDDCIKYASDELRFAYANEKNPKGKFDWDAGKSIKDSRQGFARGFWRYIYGDDNQRLSQGVESYVFYRNSLKNSCIPSANTRPSEGESTAGKDNKKDTYYDDIQWVNIYNLDKVETGYWGGKLKETDKVYIEPWAQLRDEGKYDAQNNPSKESCLNLANWMSANADAYRQDYQKYVDVKFKGDVDEAADAQVGGDGDEPTASSCNIALVGWIVCPIVNLLGTAVDGTWKILENFLSTRSEIVSTESATYKAWTTMRTFANIAFVIAFLIIIFSQISNLGITNYGIKKMLPRLIIAAILVNLSFFICQIAVDLSNITGHSLKGMMDAFANELNKDLPHPSFTGSGSDGGGVVGTILAGTAGILIIYPSLALLFPILLAGLLAVLVVLFILIARQAIIILLVVLSPLAFVAFLLPNTEGLFKKWRQTFVAMLILFPMIALVMGASEFASKILSSVFGNMEVTITNGGTTKLIGQIAAAAVSILPLFIIPGLLKKSLDAIPALGALANKISDKANGRLASKAGEAWKNTDLARGMESRKQLRQKSYDIQYAKRLGKSSMSRFMAKGVPLGEASRYANTRLESDAIAVAEKSEAEAQTSFGLLIKNFSQEEKNILGNGGKVKGLDGSKNLALRAAAWKSSLDSGDTKQINSLMNQVSDGTLGSQEAVRTFADVLAASQSRPSYIGMGHVEAMRQSVGGKVLNKDGNMESLAGANGLIENAIKNNTYSADKLASASKDELESVLSVASGMSRSDKTNLAKNLDTMFSNPSYAGRISKQVDVLNNLKAAAGRDKPNNNPFDSISNPK